MRKRLPAAFRPVAAWAALTRAWAAATHTPGERLALLRWPTPEAAEWFSIRCGAWWCLVLTPGVHLFPANPLFAGLARVGPEAVWLAVIGPLIAAQTLALLWGSPGLRAALLFFVGAVWGGVAGLTWAAAPHCPLWPFPHAAWLPQISIPKTTGVGAYGSLAADCLWASWHLVKRLFFDTLVRVDRSAGSALRAGPTRFS